MTNGMKGFFFYPEEDTLEAFRKMGANEEALRAVRENWESIAAKRRKEEGATSDQFLMGCAASLIRNVQRAEWRSGCCPP